MSQEVDRYAGGSKYIFFWRNLNHENRDPTLSDIEDMTVRLRMVGAVGDEIVKGARTFAVYVDSDDSLAQPKPELVRKDYTVKAAKRQALLCVLFTALVVSFLWFCAVFG